MAPAPVCSYPPGAALAVIGCLLLPKPTLFPSWCFPQLRQAKCESWLFASGAGDLILRDQTEHLQSPKAHVARERTSRRNGGLVPQEQRGGYHDALPGERLSFCLHHSLQLALHFAAVEGRCCWAFEWVSFTDLLRPASFCWEGQHRQRGPSRSAPKDRPV